VSFPFCGDVLMIAGKRNGHDRDGGAPIEMHTKGKSVEDAIQIFTKECGSPEPEARREAYRGTRDPGYINYTVGKLEILKLRDDYRAKMGDKFSLTDFHDRLLAGGLVPIKIIRREMARFSDDPGHS
jgi:uncharacterized protein (DUF885 family)